MTVLTEEQQAIRDQARKFAEREVVPIAKDIDLNDAEIPDSLLDKMAEMGWFGMNVPEEYGGSPADTLSQVLITEELARGMMAVGRVIHRNLMNGWILEKSGTEAQKDRYLPGIADGSLRTANGATEPEAGSDFAGIRTTAVKKGDKYIINGMKNFITWSNQADMIFLYAKTDPKAEPRHRGISCFLVEKSRGKFDEPQMIGTKLDMAGYRGMHTWQIQLNDVEVPEESLLGGVEGKAMPQLMNGYEAGRIGAAATVLGVAQAALDAAIEYAKQRKAFGKNIGKFQAVRFRLADMATEIEAGRQMLYDVAEKFDRGETCDMECGMVKLFCSEALVKHAFNGLYIHGGNGYCMDYPANRYWRDSAVGVIGEGTSDIQREIIARRLLSER